MKICVISSTVFAVPLQGYGGLESIAWLQAKGLAALGHQVGLVAPNGSTCPGVTIIPCGPPGGWDELSAYGGVKDKGYAGYWQHLPQYDCLVDHSWNKHSFLLKMEGRLKAPILAVCHAPVNTMYQELPPVEKPCFVCISDDQKSHFEALFGRPARRLYNGVDTSYYQPLGISRTKRHLFLARFSSIKGPHLAIEACRAAGVGLDLVGDTSITNEPEYFERCRKGCDGKEIRMVGPASRGECVWWFSQANCLIHPVRDFREPFGLAPVEAAACGVPCISWDSGAMRETVKHDETGWLVRSETDLLRIIERIKEAGIPDKMRQRCREWVCDNFTVDHMIRGLAALCDEAVSGGW